MALKHVFWFAPILLATAVPAVMAAGDPLASLFAPLQGIDIARLYKLHHLWIDFVIFLLLFISVAQFSIGRRMGGRPGQMLSIVIGLILAIALSLTPRSLGFSLQSFGPLAAGVIIFLVGLAVFYLIRNLGMGRSGAGSLAFLVTYFLIRATTPNFFAWLEKNEHTAWLHLVLVIAVIISMWRIVRAIWPKRSGQALGPRSAGQGNSFSEDLDRRDQAEAKVIEQDIAKPTVTELAEEQTALQRLEEAIELINRYQDDPDKLNQIADHLKRLKVNSLVRRRQAVRLKTLSRKLEKADLKSFRQLSAKMKGKSAKERQKIEREIIREKRKIISEEQLIELEQELKHYEKICSRSLAKAIKALKQSMADKAVGFLEKAVEAEKRAVAILAEMEDMEKKLLVLTNQG